MKGLAPPTLPLVATPSNGGVSRNLTPLHQLGCPKPSSALTGPGVACDRMRFDGIPIVRTVEESKALLQARRDRILGCYRQRALGV